MINVVSFNSIRKSQWKKVEHFLYLSTKKINNNNNNDHLAQNLLILTLRPYSEISKNVTLKK